MLPLLATAVVAATGDIYAGLWYPIIVAVMTLIIGAVFLRDTKGVDIRDRFRCRDPKRVIAGDRRRNIAAGLSSRTPRFAGRFHFRLPIYWSITSRLCG
jgi:hypothetical protein